MTTDEFAEELRQYRAGLISRRKFMRRAAAGGLTVAAAAAFATAISPQATAKPGKHYGRPEPFGQRKPDGPPGRPAVPGDRGRGSGKSSGMPPSQSGGSAAGASSPSAKPRKNG